MNPPGLPGNQEAADQLLWDTAAAKVQLVEAQERLNLLEACSLAALAHPCGANGFEDTSPYTGGLLNPQEV